MSEIKTQNIFNLTLAELEAYLKGLGKESYRAKQLFKWVYQEHVHDFEQMTNLSKTFRAELPGILEVSLPKLVTEHVSVDGTKKYLFDIGDNKTVESVLIPNDDRLTLCVSSEVGCNMACKFCFTAKQKLSRRLTAAEIVGQFYQVSRRLPADKRITNVVFMGMGEPLDNPDAVFRSIQILNCQSGFNFSRKRVTISTSGLVPLIPRVAESGARLAVSLNATTEEIRSQIMPINIKYSMRELLEACREYTAVTKDEVTFEYVLLKGVTDSLDDAKRLKKITKGIPCKINLIPFNEHPNSGFIRPDDETVYKFQEQLIAQGMHVLVRRTMGRDIYAACGQLRSKFEGHPGQMSPSKPTSSATL